MAGRLDGHLGGLGKKKIANPVSRALRTRNPQKVCKKVSWGLRPRGPKKSGKSLEKVRKVWKKSRKCLFGTFSRLFPDFLGPRGPGRLFSDFLGISGPEGPRDSCSSSEGSQEKDDDHDQDSLKKTFWHIWSWSSENLFLERERR